ncbi:MAG: hypothetical protein LBS27_03035 [Bifidobacteriaceae bacterium]|jgi:hypothetical protein|nr:hypothetical protein [Bifidobacteriaceae bacterium]
MTADTPRLAPIYLEDAPSQTFFEVLEALRGLSAGRAQWLAPAACTEPPPAQADAVVVPDFSGRVYSRLETLKALAATGKPIFLTTSTHGTVFMWDWEGRDWLRRRGVKTLAPNSLAEFHDLLRALSVKRSLGQAKMLAYWDDLGAGRQPDIFKRFFWWEDECSDLLRERLGVEVVKRSFRALVARAGQIAESRARQALADAESGTPMSPRLGQAARLDAMRLKLALADELDETPGVIAAGVNCLNESDSSPTTPCLAWSLLFAERGLIWGCEADLTSMITEYLVHSCLDVPVMMSNLYPFVSGQAALDHERIPYFPAVSGNPQNHILAAHCGFFGLVPQAMAARWRLEPPVLAIVPPGANVIDAELSSGQVTLVKITSTMDTLAITPAELVRYEQYEQSDCLNGGVLRVEDGERFVENLPSHHYVIAEGALRRRLELVCQVLGLETVEI